MYTDHTMNHPYAKMARVFYATDARLARLLFRRFALLNLLLGLSLASCVRFGPRDIRNYYFPLKTLTEGLVYEYQAEGASPLPTEYRYYRSLLQDTAVILTETLYSPDFLPELLASYRMVEGGMQAEDLFLFYPDSASDKRLQAEAKLVHRDVFPFQVEEQGGVYLYHARWADPSEPDHHTAILRNRYYAGDTTVTVLGEERSAVVFWLRELLEDDHSGVFEQEYTGMEIYAKGVGLVYYRKDLSNQLSLAYRLADRYPMTQLESRFKASLPEAEE